MYHAKAYSAASATSPLASTTIARRDPTEHDVQIEILFCGTCHSALHQVLRIVLRHPEAASVHESQISHGLWIAGFGGGVEERKRTVVLLSSKVGCLDIDSQVCPYRPLGRKLNQQNTGKKGPKM
jgi:hypothetical protein